MTARTPVRPDGRATTMLLGLAVEVLDYATACCEEQARLMMCRAAFDCLRALDRKPPADFETRWNRLIDLLSDQRRAGEQGAAWDEAGRDFERDIRDELTVLCGEPRDLRGGGDAL
jgi:hypothetical protein